MRPLVLILLLTATAFAKPKIIAFGRWTSVQWMVGTDEQKAMDLKVRPLLVNGEVKEITTGEPHDVTDRVFVVQRVLKINDRLPEEKAGNKRWSWRPAGWLMVDRPTAHITKLALPEFDAISSSPTWFRDYIAYCGVSENGEKLYAVVYQIGRRKPVLKKVLGPAKNTAVPEGECARPAWQKQPVRVTFQPSGAAAVSFAVRSFATEIPPEPSPSESTEEGQ